MYLAIALIVDHDMKPRAVLGAVAFAAMPLLLATPAQGAGPEPRKELGLDIISDLLKGADDQDIKIANGGPLGPGLSELVAIAEGILRKYGITKTYADVADLDAGTLSIVSGILGVNGTDGIIAAPGKRSP
ncbi:hypothetical protein Rhe02_20160 [Rhizocola hellebori]|uniref:Uncharacterized protein n=2 Tax=Rhizocola hellebori TaxID=1392758 RepID=A0A8J3Q5T7_9ACTN|nr:hypothetical protein Rhe02_20160 [Rhizocola hellebori]